MDKPAFPKTEWAIDAYGAPVINESGNGLTRRELFAAMAMQGVLSNANAMTEMLGADWSPDRVHSTAAMHAVGFADALIAALDAEPSK